MKTTQELKVMFKIFTYFIFFFFLSFIAKSMAYPLSTSSRWIIDENGQRVKLSCANWPSHLQPVVAEGLSKQPVDVVAKRVVAMGFNCVRLTWPLDLATNATLAYNVTVRQSLQSLALNYDISGFQTNNPSFLDLPLIEAFKTVVATLGNNNVMVILDNHLTKPGWCCGSNDGNGFFGDQFFDPSAWICGLTNMATIFNGVSNAIAMSLRNELRGPKQNVHDWYKYMQQGAEAVHKANPNVLVILSGLSYDIDLSFLRSQPVTLTFTGKLVFELHRYAFTDGDTWGSKNPNEACSEILKSIQDGGGFLLNEFPVFVSEFGIDERGDNVNDNRFMACFLSWVAENDVDWSIWALTGSYYLRNGVTGMIEYYGVLDSDWFTVRNPKFLLRLSLIQSQLQVGLPRPGLLPNSYRVIFHPLTGLCLVQNPHDPTTLILDSCKESSKPWSYLIDDTIRLKNESLCLQLQNTLQGTPVKLTESSCSNDLSKWEIISASSMHLAAKSTNTKTLCLDVDSLSNIVANDCKCVQTGDSSCDPMSQWFKFIRIVTY